MVTVGVGWQPYRVDSALGVSAIMRYINRRFSYLLTYLLDKSSSVNGTLDVVMRMLQEVRRCDVARHCSAHSNTRKRGASVTARHAIVSLERSSVRRPAVRVYCDDRPASTTTRRRGHDHDALECRSAAPAAPVDTQDMTVQTHRVTDHISRNATCIPPSSDAAVIFSSILTTTVRLRLPHDGRSKVESQANRVLYIRLFDTKMTAQKKTVGYGMV